MKIRVVKTTDTGFKSLMSRILRRRGTREEEVEKRVTAILRAVRRQGDRALLRFTARYDGIRLMPSTMEVKSSEIAKAMKTVQALGLSRSVGNASWSENYASGESRRLCSGRQSFLSFHGAYECCAGKG